MNTPDSSEDLLDPQVLGQNDMRYDVIAHDYKAIVAHALGLDIHKTIPEITVLEDFIPTVVQYDGLHFTVLGGILRTVDLRRSHSTSYKYSDRR